MSYEVSETQVITYNYDTWGKLISIEGNLTVAEKNPYRYRGYRYDNETGLYYLNTRYYNPVLFKEPTGLRFIKYI